MPVFKRLGGGNHSVEAFDVNALSTFSWTSGSGTIDGFSISLAEQPPQYYPSGTDNLGITNESGYGSYPLYRSIENFFYYRSSSFNEYLQYYPSDSVWVVSMGSNYYGTGVKPESFELTVNGVSDTIKDDGTGKLRFNQTGSILGNIFYTHGVAVIERNVVGSTSLTSAGLDIVSGTTVNVSINATVTIYEHTVVCTMKPREFNVTINPSAFEPSLGGETYTSKIISGSTLPYMTTIGLFNDFNECLVVGKLSVPITRQRYTDQTIIVKFDE